MGRQSKKDSSALSIRMVMQLTSLSSWQIRNYEEHNLVNPFRLASNRRIYSLQHVDELLEIQELLEQGINIAGIKKIFEMKYHFYTYRGKQLSKKQLRTIVFEEYLLGS